MYNLDKSDQAKIRTSDCTAQFRDTTRPNEPSRPATRLQRRHPENTKRLMDDRLMLVQH